MCRVAGRWGPLRAGRMQNSVLEDDDGDRATGRGPARHRSSSFSLGDKACEHERFIEGQWV